MGSIKPQAVKDLEGNLGKRPPKPQALRKITGLPSRRPKRNNIMKNKFNYTNPSANIGKYGKRFWNKFGKICFEAGLIHETDIPHLTMTCHCYDRLERAREQLGDKLLEDGQFGEKKHPLLLIIQQEEDRLSKHLQQMGLTPIARPALQRFAVEDGLEV